MSTEAFVILLSIFLYIFSFSFYTLRKKFWNPRPIFLLSLAYAILGTLSLALNPFTVVETSIPLWAKVFSLFLIFLGWFIVSVMFYSGAMRAYLKMRAWFSNKPIDYPTNHPGYSQQTYYRPPSPPRPPASRSRSSDDIVRKLLEND
jgi:hypothetical protein